MELQSIEIEKKSSGETTFQRRRRSFTFEEGEEEDNTVNERSSLSEDENGRRSVSPAPQGQSTPSPNPCCFCMEGKFKLLFGLLVVVVLLIVILVPTSFSYLEYYEMGLVKNKATGTVDTSKVYFGGRHYVGVMSTFKVFKADLHTVDFKRFTIFNKEKIQVKMTVSLQYSIRQEDLGLLHDTYNTNYDSVAQATVLSAIKTAATGFAITEFRLERPKVSAGLQLAAAKALSGDCCRKNCDKYTCLKNCTAYENCNKSNKGVFCSLENFQMQEVSLTKLQVDRFMKTAVEDDKADTAEHVKMERIVRKKTSELRIKNENIAKEILQKGNTNSTLIRALATSQSEATVNNARNKGLNIIYSALNITEVAHKNSLDYLRTLLNHNNADMYVGFQYMVANGKP